MQFISEEAAREALTGRYADYFERALADALERGQRPDNPCLLTYDALAGIWAICDAWPVIDADAVASIRERQAIHAAWLAGE